MNTRAEGQRPTPSATSSPGDPDDIRFGQVVVVTARWILVLAGLILSVWVTGPQTPQVIDQVKISFIVLAALMFANFYLTLQLLRARPSLPVVAYTASAADLIVISLLIQVQGGFSSNVYIFYFPALLAISVAFPLGATMVYTLATIGLYGSIAYASLATLGAVTTMDQQALIARLVMFAAVAFCGQLYFRIEHDRRRDAEAANAPVRSPRQEAAEDIFFGQLVIIWARWAVIAVAIILVIWSATDLGQLTLNILLVVALMAMNFFLHGMYAVERPQNRAVVSIVSVLDLAIVSLIVLLWPGSQGLKSPFFVFYYPFVLAFAFVFPWRSAVAYAGTTIVAYVAINVVTLSVTDLDGAKTLLMRGITLASTGALATMYWRIQRDRRRAAYGVTAPGGRTPTLTTARA